MTADCAGRTAGVPPAPPETLGEEPSSSQRPQPGRRRVLVVVDVDGVVSPLHGDTAWTDDTEVGDLFGPVVISPALAAHLDALNAIPDVTCMWLTDWTPEMRARMRTFPGSDWPWLERQDRPSASRSWWKFAALHSWLSNLSNRTPRTEFFDSLAWLDDDLDTRTIRAACRRLLRPLISDVFMIAPQPSTGITPAEMVQAGEWIKARVEKGERYRVDQPWRLAPVAPCGCQWDGWHCPHCRSVTDTAGDAWYPFHTLRCHRDPVQRVGS